MFTCPPKKVNLCRHFHVVVGKWPQRNVQKSVRNARAIVVLLKKSQLLFVAFSLVRRYHVDKQQNYLFSLDSRARLRLRWLVLQLPFVDKLEVAAWSLPDCDERGVEIDELFTELLALASLASLGLGLNDVLTTSLERLFFKSPPSSFFSGEKYSFIDLCLCWGLGSDLFVFLGTVFLSFVEGLFREAILKAQMSRANNSCYKRVKLHPQNCQTYQ